MKNKRLTRLICLILSIVTVLCLAGCADDKPAQSELEKSLTFSLKNYLDSDEFASDALSANTARDRLLLMYLRYVNKTFYNADNAAQFKNYLNFIEELTVDGELSDGKFTSSSAHEQGWRGIPDYLYSWSLIYNQYMQYCRNGNITDATFEEYVPIIRKYIKRVDDFLRTGKTDDADTPVTNVAWAHDITNVLPMISANLGISDQTPYCDETMLSYYEKTDNGYVKEGGTCDWVGFSGRPVCASLYRNNPKYDVKYEKTMQGYFPFTDGWNQPLEEMVNLDRLCNYYDHTLTSGANATPQFALLTAMMHGLDMEQYKKEVPLENEAADKTYNVITLWRNGLKTDNSGNYAIDNITDMAVAIAYLAQCKGIDAPSPLGTYSAKMSLISL